MAVIDSAVYPDNLRYSHVIFINLIIVCVCYAVAQDICKTLLVCTVTRSSQGLNRDSSSDDVHKDEHDPSNVSSTSTSDSYTQWHSNAVIVTELAVNTARTARGKGEHSNINTNTSTDSSTDSATKAAADTIRRVQRK
jgi:hypothetical protein